MDTERLEAVRQILIQLDRLAELGASQQAIDKVRREVIFYFCEIASEPKWSLNRPHSAKARKYRQDSVAAGRRFVSAEFRYDHAIPLAALRGQFKHVTCSNEALKEFLDNQIRGVIVLKTEDDELTRRGLQRCLPDGCATNNLTARYAKAEIEFTREDEERLMKGHHKSSQPR